ncbi:hypothetical protein H180DRAFT_01544 [Streptomyces sp. WMMB 322]|nr:hypothetical protein H180DRAFT_01544 [Streptomyces sp. WMMB 322]
MTAPTMARVPFVASPRLPRRKPTMPKISASSPRAIPPRIVQNNSAPISPSVRAAVPMPLRGGRAGSHISSP